MDKTLKTIVFILLLVFYGSFLFNNISLPAADDLPRHLKNGELILKGQSSILHSNTYSYTMPDQSFVNHHWLSGVVFYLVQQAAGWNGLIIFKVLILLLAFSIMFRLAMKQGGFWLAALLSLPAIIILSSRHGIRPEIFSYLFIAVFIFLLMDSEEHQGKRIYWLIPLQVLWVNLHIFFIAGPALVGGFILERMIRRRSDQKGVKEKSPIKPLSILFLSLIAVCCINPNFISGAIYPFQIFTNYGMEVSENFSLLHFLSTASPGDNIPAFISLFSILLFLTSFLFNWKRKPLFYFLAGIAAAVGGLFMIRLVSIFGLVFLPAVAYNLGPWWERKVRFDYKVAGVYVAGLAVLIVLRFSGNLMPYIKPGMGLAAHSEDAASFFKTHQLKGPVFNDFDIGSYLIYEWYPKEKVFIDNRAEAYSAAFFRDTYLPVFRSADAWRSQLDKNQFNTLILYFYSKGEGVDKFIFDRANDTAWAMVYADPYAVIFVRNNEQNSTLIRDYRITRDNVEQRLDYLVKSKSYDDEVAAADIFCLAGRVDLGMHTYFDVVTRWPQQGRIWMKMGERMIANDNFSSTLLAMMYFDKAVSVGYRTAEVYTYLGLAYMKAGYQDKSKEMLKQALSINPDYSNAKEMLMSFDSRK